MKTCFSILLIISVILSACVSSPSGTTITVIHADTLVSNIDKFIDTTIETEGTIIHVCGVDGKKAKLQTPGGEIIRMDVSDSIPVFDKSLNHKKITVTGVVSEIRITESYLDSIANTQLLLCHVDHKPCKDEEWVNGKVEAGVANEMLSKSIDKLKMKLNETENGYLSVLVIQTDKIEEIQ